MYQILDLERRTQSTINKILDDYVQNDGSKGVSNYVKVEIIFI